MDRGYCSAWFGLEVTVVGAAFGVIVGVVVIVGIVVGSVVTEGIAVGIGMGVRVADVMGTLVMFGARRFPMARLGGVGIRPLDGIWGGRLFLAIISSLST